MLCFRDLSETAIQYLPTSGLEELEVLVITNTPSLKTIPSIYDLTVCTLYFLLLLFSVLWSRKLQVLFLYHFNIRFLQIRVSQPFFNLPNYQILYFTSFGTPKSSQFLAEHFLNFFFTHKFSYFVLYAKVLQSSFEIPFFNNFFLFFVVFINEFYYYSRVCTQPVAWMIKLSPRFFRKSIGSRQSGMSSHMLCQYKLFFEFHPCYFEECPNSLKLEGC